MAKKEPSIYNLENMGPNKPIESLNEAIQYIKRLSSTMERKVPYTADRLRQCMLEMKKAQQKINSQKQR